MRDSYHILYWRDIPSLVRGKQGRTRFSSPLDKRFMQAIDAAAMRTGDTSSDEYLDDWQPSPAKPLEGDAQACLDSVAADLELAYPRDRLLAMIKNGGRNVD